MLAIFELQPRGHACSFFGSKPLLADIRKMKEDELLYDFLSTRLYAYVLPCLCANTLISCSRSCVIIVPVANLGKANSDSDLFPEKFSSYVPSGLTKEEYDDLKQKEKEETQKKKFGMFGPRFRPSDPPSGDWMLMPSLWTGGYQVNNKIRNSDGSIKRRHYFEIFRRRLVQYTPSFVIAFVLVDLFLAGSAMLHASQLTLRSAAILAFQSVLWKRRHAVGIWSTALKIVAVKIAVSSLITLPINRLIVHAKRRWLWSPRRTFTTSLLTGLGLLMLWTAALAGLR
jgi:hypothetical protein